MSIPEGSILCQLIKNLPVFTFVHMYNAAGLGHHDIANFPAVTGDMNYLASGAIGTSRLSIRINKHAQEVVLKDQSYLLLHILLLSALVFILRKNYTCFVMVVIIYTVVYIYLIVQYINPLCGI